MVKPVIFTLYSKPKQKQTWDWLKTKLWQQLSHPPPPPSPYVDWASSLYGKVNINNMCAPCLFYHATFEESFTEETCSWKAVMKSHVFVIQVSSRLHTTQFSSRLHTTQSSSRLYTTHFFSRLHTTQFSSSPQHTRCQPLACLSVYVS